MIIRVKHPREISKKDWIYTIAYVGGVWMVLGFLGAISAPFFGESCVVGLIIEIMGGIMFLAGYIYNAPKREVKK